MKKLESTCLDSEIEIALVDKGFVKFSTLPRSEWRAVPGGLKAIVRRLMPLIDEEKAHWNGDNLVVNNAVASQFPEGMASALGLPSPAPVFVDISFIGTIGSHPFVQVDWKDTNYQQISPKRIGLQIHWAGRKGRLQGPLYRVIDAIDRFNAVSTGELSLRVERWNEVASALAIVNPNIRSADDYTKSLTVFQAGSFALDIRGAGEQVEDFLPILMHRGTARTLDDNAPIEDFGVPLSEQEPVEDLVDEESTRLLTSEDQRAFERHFSAQGEAKRAYTVRKNTFLLIDPDLQKALHFVKHARNGTPEEKREFVKNPRAAIAKALGADGFEGITTSLFIETKQYSDRVLGLGLWHPPELSWLSKATTQWLPEQIPVRLGDEDIEINLEELNELRSAVEQADSSKVTEVIFRNRNIPVEHARAAVQQISRYEEAEFDTPSDRPEQLAKSAPSRPIVVQIKTNFEGIAYEVSRKPRQAWLAQTQPISKKVKTAFKPHQDEGFKWLVDSWLAGWAGVLLADDMGLGKSYQALAFLVWIKENMKAAAKRGARRKLPILIVAPTALLENWIKEAETHLAPGALGADRANVFGSGIRRFRNNDPERADEEPLDWRKIEEHDWVLTTYETLADNHTAFAKIAFAVAVFDEIQKIKEPGTLNTWAAKAMNANFVLGLSGTPIENRIEDLWSIMDRVSPGLLGDLRVFSARYKEARQEHFRALSDSLLKPSSGAPAIILRRMKDDVLEGLPKKEVFRYPTNMPSFQASSYEDIVRTAAAARDRGRGAKLEVVQNLRGISLFPGDPTKFDLSSKDACRDWMERSARVGKTFEILHKLEQRGQRALIFVEHRTMQSLLADAISTVFEIDRPLIINGATPGPKRQRMVDEFELRKSRFDVMVLSPKAAGVGLTIISANHVIHLSRWWNPAVEDQCNDRVYRIGQKKPVEVHIPIARHPRYPDDSFDLLLDEMLERKRRVSRGLLVPPVSDADLDEMFTKVVA